MPVCTRMDDFCLFVLAIRKNVPVYKLTFYNAVKSNDNKNNKKEREKEHTRRHARTHTRTHAHAHTHKEQYMTDLFKCFNFFDSFGFLIEVILEIFILRCNLCCEENYEKEPTAGVLKTAKTHQLQIRKRSRL